MKWHIMTQKDKIERCTKWRESMNAPKEIPFPDVSQMDMVRASNIWAVLKRLSKEIS